MPLEQHCSAEGCSRAASTELDGRPFCTEHFMIAAYRFLDDAAVQIRHTAMQGTSATEELARRLDDCTRATTGLAMSGTGTDNLARARLIDILLWAADLFKQVRRGPRAGMTIPVALEGSAEGGAWEETTQTQTISRHGASLNCGRALAQGEMLKVKRLDTGQQGTARVVWIARRQEGVFEIGLELLSEQDLWGVDLDLPETLRGGAGSGAPAQ